MRSGIPFPIVCRAVLISVGFFLAAGLSPVAAQGCEWCGAPEAPPGPDWQGRIAGPDEPGEPLVISGRILRADGKTPAAGVLLYVYHTNAEGIYPTRGDETGNGTRHGYLRAWFRTDEKGRYKFTTIRPASYPNSRNPQHIHATVTPPGGSEYWIASYHFDDDPLITKKERRRSELGGGENILVLTRDGEGVWHGVRDIVLKE